MTEWIGPDRTGPAELEPDRIELKGLRVKGFHGVFDHERRAGQEFVVDAVLYLDTRAAADEDDLAETVDYGSLAAGLAEIVRGEPVDLIETLADRLVVRCLADERVQAAQVTVHKPSAPIPELFADVAVSVLRRRAAAGRSPSAAGSGEVAVLALGANLGERQAILQSAVDALAALDGVRVLAVSPVVETAAVGGPDQPDYLNAVLTVRTTVAAETLLAACHGIEAAHGRRRAVRWGPRTLDIDLISYGSRHRSGPGLVLPHPRAAERAFVLHPWSLLDPDAELLDAGRVADLARRAPDRDGVRERRDLVLRVPPQDAAEDVTR